VSLKEIKSLNIVQRKNEYRRIKQENEVRINLFVVLMAVLLFREYWSD